MKKLLSFTLFLSILLLLPSCSSDDDNDNNGGGTTTFDNWNDPKSSNYKPEGYNPLLGEWIKQNTNNTYKVIFTSDFKYQESWYEKGAWLASSTIGTYIINDKAFKYNNEVHNYSISNDVLTIEYTGGSIKYDKVR